MKEFVGERQGDWCNQRQGRMYLKQEHVDVRQRCLGRRVSKIENPQGGLEIKQKTCRLSLLFDVELKEKKLGRGCKGQWYVGTGV